MTRFAKLTTFAALLTVVTAVTTSTALAHVTIEPATVQRGQFSTLVFRVPNERADSATTRVRVQLPPEYPMASVSVRPVPGWTVTLERTQPTDGQQGNIVDTVSVISWEGGRIEPGFYESFEVNLGPMPENADVLYFPTIQYYDDGSEVAWIEVPNPDGSNEVESPAPEVELITSASGTRDSHGQIIDSENAASASPAQTTTSSDDSTTAVTIASLSLGIALVALVAAAVGWFTFFRNRPSSAQQGTGEVP
jgi:uncharacterized protein YcnI